MADQTPPPNVQFPSVQNSGSTPPPPPPGQPVYIASPPRRSFASRFLNAVVILIFIFSLLANMYMSAILGTTLEPKFQKKTLVTGSEDQTIAIYRIAGTISDATARQFADFYREVKDDSKVKAVVIRMDSPGGTVAASDEIWAMLRSLRHDKKVVVSMGAFAASGGYYISSGADEIFAEETTITGSIGVIAMWLVVEQGLDKLGIEPMVVKSTHATQWKDEMSPFKAPDKRQMAHLQATLDSMQARFEKVVKEGRGTKLKLKETSYAASAPSGEVKTINETEPFNGKVYLAPEAKEIGLVDDLGYLDDAIARTKTLANVKNPRIVQYEPRRSLMEKVFSGQSEESVKIDINLLDEVRTPRVMMLWQP